MAEDKFFPAHWRGGDPFIIPPSAQQPQQQPFPPRLGAGPQQHQQHQQQPNPTHPSQLHAQSSHGAPNQPPPRHTYSQGPTPARASGDPSATGYTSAAYSSAAYKQVSSPGTLTSRSPSHDS
jgi:hypothetical protein